MAKAKSTDAPPSANGTVSKDIASDSSNLLYGWVWFGIAAYVVVILVKTAYRIRMGAINEFGAVIHEFDPYFNYRATEVSLPKGFSSNDDEQLCWRQMTFG